MQKRFKKDKKGQVTIFIIIAIFIIGTVLVFFLSNRKQEIEDVELIPIQTYVQSCLEKTVQKGVYYLGIQGGYYNTPEPKENYLLLKIPIYWNLNSENVPSHEKIEAELNDYVLDNIGECLGNFKSFKDRGFNIRESGSPSGKATIKESIIFDLRYPLTIEKGKLKSTIQDFSYTFDFDFLTEYYLSRMIIEEQKKTPGEIPIGYLSALAYEKGFVFETIDLENNKTLISLIFNKTDDEGYPFVYSFIIDHSK